MKLVAKFYLIFLSLTPYVPAFNTIDSNAAEWFYLSLLNLVFLVLLFYLRQSKTFQIKSKIFISFLVFFVLAFISSFFAINQTESFVRLSDVGVILISLYIVYFFIKNDSISFKFLILLLSCTLIIDISGTLYNFIYFFRDRLYDFNDAMAIKGFYANKNITAAAIGLKIPILLYSLKYYNKRIIKILVISIASISFMTLYLLSARALFLSYIVSISIVFFLILYRTIKFDNNILSSFKPFIPLFLSVIFGYIVFINLNTAENLGVDSRFETVVKGVDDESINQRVTFYGHAIESISNNFFFGVGIGNWKIYSVKYWANEMPSYTVPKHVHNDFLEIFAETGFFGFTAYFLFFLFIIIKLTRVLVNTLNLDKTLLNSLIILPFIIIIIDTNLNFPLDRPSIQASFIICIAILETFIKENTDEK
ncbi:MAG: O-antigen ligase family protein [Flavobacteriaceae bacterium]|nr:O-antigen ligase family protein [Flavobacteriaceae bacterium]